MTVSLDLNVDVDLDLPIDPAQPLPFEDFYLPLVQTARGKLCEVIPVRQLNYLSKIISRSLERDLLIRLVDIGTQTLLREFDRFRDPQISLDSDNPDRTGYIEFITSLLSGKINLFQDYPVLDRLVNRTIDLWVASTAEFIQRLDSDLELLATTFAQGQELGQLQAVETGLSDRHCGGRSVFVLTFTSEIKIVYKPKDLSLDIAFDRLLAWFNDRHISLPFKLLKLLNRQDYGWQEFIEQQPCVDRSAVQNFYHRSGMLLSLLFMLEAKDCEHEHLISCGEYPQLIDADALLCPQLIDADALLCPQLTDDSEADRWFEDSVLRSGFLPRWNGTVYSTNALDSSAIGNIFPKQTNAAREWKFINTDRMNLVAKTAIVPAGKNAVLLDGKTVSPQGYISEIISGFQEISQLFIDRRSELLAENSPLAAFANCRSRIYLRSTINYGAAFNRALAPEYLQEPSEHRILINRILSDRVPNSIESRQQVEREQIFAAEARSLQQQDLPYFSVACNGTDLEIDRVTIVPNFFTIPSYQQSIEKIRAFNTEHLALQVKLIRSSFAAKYAHTVKDGAALQGNLPLDRVLSTAELQQEAIEIGRDLLASAVWDGTGCNWLEFSYMFRANRYQLALLNDSLYSGRAGVSLFLAALSKLTGERQFQDVAIAGLDPFCKSIAAGNTRSEIIECQLGLIGLGGTIYSLVKMSQLLAAPELLETAIRAAKLLTPDVIAADNKFDVMWGATGAILGLSALYRATGDRSILEIAIACGNHLLTNRTKDLPKAWVTIPSESGKPLTGFSHGAAGIGLALLRLYKDTDDRDYLTAALEGIEYERSVFDATVQNWPDFRMSEQRGEIGYLDAWCHGSAGIGLARLASWVEHPSDDIRQEIDIALSTSQQNGIFNLGIDHLCCGNIGKIELLVVASQLFGDRQLLESARVNASKMVNAAREIQSYRLISHPIDRIFSPSFYRGAAGIGYQLLRVADPDEIESIATWK